MSIMRTAYQGLKQRLPHQMQPYLLAHAAFHAACGGRVVSGPFKGLRYVRTGIESAYYAKLLGAYECELHDVMHRLNRCGFDRLIDIGAAEGYYAAGIAYLDPEIEVIAFEGDRRGQKLQDKMVASNGLQDRFISKSWCDREALGEALEQSRRPLLIVDCEGAEFDLLIPDHLPDLKQAVVVLELHNFAHPDMDLEQTLRDRFSTTHHIRKIDMDPRDVSDFPETGHPILDRLGDKTKAYLVDEGRPHDTPWLVLSPKLDHDTNRRLGFPAQSDQSALAPTDLGAPGPSRPPRTSQAA